MGPFSNMTIFSLLEMHALKVKIIINNNNWDMSNRQNLFSSKIRIKAIHMNNRKTFLTNSTTNKYKILLMNERNAGDCRPLQSLYLYNQRMNGCDDISYPFFLLMNAFFFFKSYLPFLSLLFVLF